MRRVFDQVLSGRKEHTEGTHRARSPRATVEAWWPLREHFGITRLANVTGLDYVGIPVVQGIRPNARNLAVSQGKGLTLDAARASALMEAIEGWHAENLVVRTCFEPRRTLARRHEVVPLDPIPRHKPLPDDIDDVAIPWVLGYDIARDVPVWVPHEAVSLDRSQKTYLPDAFMRNSCGLASGNTLAEAVLHGLCEVIEHDAHTLWHVDSRDPDGTAGLVDLATVDDPAALSILDAFRSASFTLGVQDITSDVGIPAYQCVVIDDVHSFAPMGYAWGEGCHPAREVALLRALTEAAQARLTVIAGARDDLEYETYAFLYRRELTIGLSNTLNAAHPTLDFRARPSVATDSFESDLDLVLARLRAVGCDSVLIVDLTHPDLGIPVVKVIVPGLEGVAEQCLLGGRARRIAELSGSAGGVIGQSAGGVIGQ